MWTLILLLLLAQDAAPASTAAPAARVSSATQPAPQTQPAVVDRGRIDLMKILRGEQVLTFEQFLELGPWVQIATDLVVTILSFIPRVLVAIFLFFIFWLIYRGIRRVVVAAMDKANMDPSIRDMLVSMLKWAILGFALVIAGNQVGIQIAALLTGVSIIGIAIGFAAQETLANFIAGVVIFWDKPFRIGDWIDIEGVFAQVQRVTFRSTRLLNLDGEVIVLPNTYMLSHRVSNHSSNPINRVNIPIGIAYKSSIDEARKVLLELTRGDSRLCTDPAAEVVVSECADSSVNLLLRFWIRDESIERVIGYEYLEKAKKALDAAGIEMPFPHLQLFVESTPAIVALAGRTK